MPERQSTPGGATAEQDAEAEPRGPAVTPAGDAAGLDEEPTRPVRRRASAPVPPGEDATVGFSRAITPTASAPSGRLPDDDRSPADDRTARVGTPDATVAVPDHPTAGQNRDGSAPGRLDADVVPAGTRDGTPASGERPTTAPRVGDRPAGATPVGDHPADAWTAADGVTIPASDRRSATNSIGDRPTAGRTTDGGAATPIDDDPTATTPAGDRPTAPWTDDRSPATPAGDGPTVATPIGDRPIDAWTADGRRAGAGPNVGDGGTAAGTPDGSAASPAGDRQPASHASAEVDNGASAPTSPEADTTQVLPFPDAPTVQIAAHPGPDPHATAVAAEAPTVAQPTPSSSKEQPPTRSWRRRLLLIGGGFVAALALLYGGDLALSSGSVPRGVTVEGVPVGGLAYADAEQTLRAQIEPRTTRPVPVTVDGATSTVDPSTAGLAVDWPATFAQAEHQPLDPVTRIASFFTTREVGVVTKVDPASLDAALTELKPAFDKPAVEGNIRFDGTTPQPVQPAAGQQLDLPAAAAVLTRDWASGAPVALPLTRIEPVTTSDHVDEALQKIAKPAVSAPITVTGENDTTATLTPQNLAAALTFRADPTAGLVPELNQDVITKALQPQLADSETPGRDATLDFTGPTPVVVPSQDGRGVDYPATLKVLLPALTAPAPRQVAAVYGEQPAKITTEALSKMGIAGIIGEFTTRGFAADSGMNIKRAAEQINGVIVQPGATFSLNAATNPRDAAHGYVEAGIIEDGHPARGIGGGVSQVATTLYNAAYFAGMTNVEHKEHSFYISRYPAGREATVFDNLIDLKFRNDNPTAIMIQTTWTPGTINVRIYGTKRYDVTSTTGPRTNPTEPKTVKIPEGEQCTPGEGAPGFTVTDTRTLKDVSTGQVRSETRTVRYNPSPTIECGDDD